MTEPRFRYRALDAQGAEKAGTVDAPDEGAAARALLRQGLQPVMVEPLTGRGSSATPDLGASRKVGDTDRIVCLRELATLLESGVSVAEALPSMAQAYAGSPLGAGLEYVRRSVTMGENLVAALRGSSLGLPAYAIALAEAGDASGRLPASLQTAANQMEQARRAREELRTALTYPTILVVVGLVVVTAIFLGVIPRFTGLLSQTRADIPEMSRILIASAVWARQNLVLVGISVLAALALLVAAVSGEAGARRLARVAARLPVVGPWLLQADIGRWATVLGELLDNRVPMMEALRLSASSVRLEHVARDVARLGTSVSQGRSLADGLADVEWFPPQRINLVRVGERSGALARTLSTLGQLHTESAREQQRRLLSWVEPVAILVIGAVVGLLMVAVMSALTSVNAVAF